MNKTKADEIALTYQKKIFGFAMSKVRELSEAEELAADIVFELYKSLTKAHIVANIDGYVYRIANNVYAKYLDKKNKHKHLDVFDINCAVVEERFEDIENEEIFKMLRKNIGLLSQRQRSIVYMKYYQNMTVEDISKVLSISSGTVKWHLTDARNSLKEKIVMNVRDNLSVNPIKFISMGHSGNPGTSGDTTEMFDSRLKQNIAWSCYYEAKNIEQIAKDLEIPIAYVEGELLKLVEWGYIDQIDDTKNPKYLTNMYITDSRMGFEENGELNKEVVKYLCDNLFEKVFDEFDRSEDNWGFECPNNDKNFVKYNLIMLVLKNICHGTWEGWDRFAVKRPDGGQFIAYATVTDDCTKIVENPYCGCGYMNRQVYAEDKLLMHSIQYNCNYCDREISWRVNENRDWEDLYAYIENGCDKEKISIESYSNLCKKGYVADEKVQVLTLKLGSDNPEIEMDNHIKKFINYAEDVLEQEKIFDDKYFEVNRKKFPKHMDAIVKYHNTQSFSRSELIPFIIEEMLNRGELEPLTNVQKKAVLSIVSM